MGNSEKLLDCPFCGSGALLHADKRSPAKMIRCVNGGCGAAVYDPREERVIEKWNRRPMIEFECKYPPGTVIEEDHSMGTKRFKIPLESPKMIIGSKYAGIDALCRLAEDNALIVCPEDLIPDILEHARKQGLKIPGPVSYDKFVRNTNDKVRYVIVNMDEFVSEVHAGRLIGYSIEPK